ncbi:MAG: hypothetical protein HYV09_37545 [Deltaproteobacteria bacterium]|nr:hypothetical protein [Deltaproteobacteria bacterium]
MPPPSRSLDRRDLLALFAIAFAAAALVGTHGLVYWDAGDYVRLALEGGPSGLLLGRPLFLLVSRAILRVAFGVGVDPAHAEPILRWSWTLASSAAPPLLSLLGARLGLERRAAACAGLALALSPAFAHTAHQALTDGPALALSIGALAVVARPGARPGSTGRAIAGGAILAAAIATRETAAVHLVALVLLAMRNGRRAAWAAAATTVGCAAAIVVLAHRGLPPSLTGWTSAMGRSSRLGPIDVAISLGWVLAIGPLPVVLGARALRTVRGDTAIVAWPAAAATALLLLYPFGAYSPRYVLSTAPIALLLPAAAALARNPRLTLTALLVPLAIAWFATERTRAVAARGVDASARFAARSLPDRALIVPGHYCPHVRLSHAIEARKTGAPRDVALLCPGWDWPDDPATTLDRARCDGRTLLLDLRDDAWVGAGEVAPREQIQGWARQHALYGPIATSAPQRCVTR